VTVKLSKEEISKASAVTVGHYDQRAEIFWRDTRDHDVSQNIDALLQVIVGAPPFRILDFGCGPGRDLKAFKDLGHQAIGLDGSARFAEMARNFSDCDVWHQDFLKLQLPAAYFDGVFANASLFHVPSQELPRVLKELYATLKPNGVLFSSNPRGDNQEGWNGERYGTYLDWPKWRELVTGADFKEIHHYYRPPGLPREQQPWLASVWRKPA
jgi:SAM-dependent methyltransferase